MSRTCFEQTIRFCIDTADSSWNSGWSQKHWILIEPPVENGVHVIFQEHAGFLRCPVPFLQPRFVIRHFLVLRFLSPPQQIQKMQDWKKDGSNSRAGKTTGQIEDDTNSILTSRCQCQ